MTGPQNARSPEVTAPPPSGGRGPAAQALAAVLDAPTSVQQMLAYDRMLTNLTDRRAAIHDGVCRRVRPVDAWARCLSTPDGRATHTAANQRWAVATDMPYGQYPLVDTCWQKEGP